MGLRWASVRVGRSPSCLVDRPRRESPELMKILVITGCNPVGLRFYGPTIRARWVVPWGISAVACGPPIVHRMVLVSGRLAELLRERRFLHRELGSRGGYRSRYVLFVSGVRLVGVEVQRDKKMPVLRILWASKTDNPLGSRQGVSVDAPPRRCLREGESTWLWVANAGGQGRSFRRSRPRSEHGRGPVSLSLHRPAY